MHSTIGAARTPVDVGGEFGLGMTEILAFFDTAPGGAVLFGLLTAYPFVRIFKRASLPAWPVVLVFVPIIGPGLVFAALVLMKWPGPRSAAASRR